MGQQIDPLQSISWYRRAASQGHAEAELALSGWYLTGADDGVFSADPIEAVKWAKRSADKGHSPAQLAMGYYYENGIGTPVDIRQAIMCETYATRIDPKKQMDKLSINSGEYVLITGGAGYIGSHTVLELLSDPRGFNVVVVDDLSNSCEESLQRVAELTGKRIFFHKLSICDEAALSHTFSLYPNITSVIHFAGMKSVNESVSMPLHYYTTNVTGSLNLLKVMRNHGVFNLVFSSSATVYGQPEIIPIPETHKFGPTNPYGTSKLMVENIIRDTCQSEPRFNAAILRYFNPVGAHSSGRIGEDPAGIPNNLMPYLSQVLVGKLPYLNVYGNDYETKDGTGVRDFVHVVDLALGHVAACKHLTDNAPGCVVYNMGTGTGYSVLDMVKGMETAAGMELKYQFAERRPGDVGEVVADPSKVKKEMKWVAKRNIGDMCADTWRWQSANPKGFGGYSTKESPSYSKVFQPYGKQASTTTKESSSYNKLVRTNAI
ncbi:hypothetical protein HK096_002194 [Nowakowskiella sp. JEL0078]|nr:hypothetical protein HK096_002194 [Nowakowskiella sp. JEL0078]